MTLIQLGDDWFLNADHVTYAHREGDVVVVQCDNAGSIQLRDTAAQLFLAAMHELKENIVIDPGPLRFSGRIVKT